MVWSFLSVFDFTDKKYPCVVDADELLDQAPYRFERNEPQPGNAPPQKSQPSPSTSQSVQPALQQFLPQLISQVFPNLQTPDPNNIYDQLKYFEGKSARCLPIHPLTSS